MPPPFRLLAITPPHGPVPADIVKSWPGAGPGLALLLREPGRTAHELLAADGRLGPLRRACVAAGIPVLLSVGRDDLDLAIPPDIAGLHLRGDPDLATLTRARLIRPVPSDSPGPISSDPRTSLVAASSDRSPFEPIPTHRASSPRTSLVAASSDRSPFETIPARRASRPRPSIAALSAPWLGRSCHGAPQPGHALVDYTLFAPIFAPTTGQPSRPLGSKLPAGLDALRTWTAAPGACVFALGGVGPVTAAACLAAGAHGLAGIGVFFGEPGQVAQDVAALREIVAASDRHVEPVSPR